MSYQVQFIASGKSVYRFAQIANHRDGHILFNLFFFLSFLPSFVFSLSFGFLGFGISSPKIQSKSMTSHPAQGGVSNVARLHLIGGLLVLFQVNLTLKPF